MKENLLLCYLLIAEICKAAVLAPKQWFVSSAMVRLYCAGYYLTK